MLVVLDQVPQQVQQELEELLGLALDQNRLSNPQHRFPIAGSLIQAESAMLECR